MNTAFEHFAEEAGKLGCLNIRVSQGGELIESCDLLDEECRRNIYSASKSFTSAAVGIAMREGLLSLDEKLVDVFPEEIPEDPDDHLKHATVRDLLTMRMGQEKACLMGGQRPYYQEDNWVRLALSIPFIYEPDTKFVYNNAGPYLAGVLVQRRAGCDLVSYLMPRLFAPLGIRRPMWEADPYGQTFGAGGLFLMASELHRFGQLYLQEGNWQGRQLIPADWVHESTKQQGEDPYGYLFWRGNNNTFRADGKYAQLSIVAPDQDAVVTLVSWNRDKEPLMKLVDDYIAAL